MNYTSVSPAEFHTRTDVSDWRVITNRIEATFAAPSFAQGAAFIVQVAQAADAAVHHPDLELRYPGRVHIVLTTHAAHGLTTADVDLAIIISGLAAAGGLRSEPLAGSSIEIGIDTVDVNAIRPFWKAVLGYADDAPYHGTVWSLHDPVRVGPPVWFQQMDVARPQRNHIHLDVVVPHDVAEERVGAAIAAGGHLLSDGRARAFWVLADPEGNEACVCTWQDRAD